MPCNGKGKIYSCTVGGEGARNKNQLVTFNDNLLTQSHRFTGVWLLQDNTVLATAYTISPVNIL